MATLISLSEDEPRLNDINRCNGLFSAVGENPKLLEGSGYIYQLV
jgi:hypothetical protein